MDAPIQQITALNFLVGEALAEASINAADMAQWESIDCGCYRLSWSDDFGTKPNPHSIWNGNSLSSIGTMQIGEPSVIAARTGCTVVADFRAADMAVGGQGAPLVPFADYALFADRAETRAVQNIGGIGNVTYLRASGRLEDVVAFDTGPGNMLLDGISRLTTGRDCDENGAVAAAGRRVCRPLLETWLEHPFFSLKPPRTTGRELFGVDMSVRMLREGTSLGISNADVMASATALTAESIARAYRTLLNPISNIECVVLGGGGAHNPTLVAMIKKALAPARKFQTTHEEFGIDGDAKEATAFALLAYETLNGRPSNVAVLRQGHDRRQYSAR